MNELEILAKNVKCYRLQKNLNQAELAEKVGLTVDSICRVEKSKMQNIGLKYLMSLSQVLDIELFELFLENPDIVNIKFIVGKRNLHSLERVLDKISERVEIRFKRDPNAPFFYHPGDCECKKCKEKRGEK